MKTMAVLISSLSFPGNGLGRVTKNIQKFVNMSYGCGEYNMILFVPNIYALKYLNETQKLTENIKSKALGYIHAG